MRESGRRMRDIRPGTHAVRLADPTDLVADPAARGAAGGRVSTVVRTRDKIARPCEQEAHMTHHPNRRQVLAALAGAGAGAAFGGLAAPAAQTTAKGVLKPTMISHVGFTV